MTPASIWWGFRIDYIWNWLIFELAKFKARNKAEFFIFDFRPTSWTTSIRFSPGSRFKTSTTFSMTSGTCSSNLRFWFFMKVQVFGMKFRVSPFEVRMQRKPWLALHKQCLFWKFRIFRCFQLFVFLEWILINILNGNFKPILEINAIFQLPSAWDGKYFFTRFLISSIFSSTSPVKISLSLIFCSSTLIELLILWNSKISVEFLGSTEFWSFLIDFFIFSTFESSLEASLSSAPNVFWFQYE